MFLTILNKLPKLARPKTFYAHNISYVRSVNMIFALDYLNNRELVTPELSCHLRISKNVKALPNHFPRHSLQKEAG